MKSDKRKYCFKFKHKFVRYFLVAAIENINVLSKLFGKNYDGLIDDITKTFIFLSFWGWWHLPRCIPRHTHTHTPAPALLGREHWRLWNLNQKAHPATIIIPTATHGAVTQCICTNSFIFHKAPMKLVLLLFLLVVVLLVKWENQNVKSLSNLPKITRLCVT